MLTFQQTEGARLRKLWRGHFAECARLAAAYNDASAAHIRSGGGSETSSPRPPCYPPFPAELRGLTCGAENRGGEPCKRTDLMTNGRCRFHGGMSTGPKSDEGRRTAAANLSKRWSVENAASEPHAPVSNAISVKRQDRLGP